jgi:cytochrome b561
MPLPRDRYSAVAIVLHWTIAALILWNIVLGMEMNGLKPLPGGAVRVDLLSWGAWHVGWTEHKAIAPLLKFQVFQLHKSVGFTVLFFSLLRLAWRLAHRPPPFPPTMKRWEKLAAETVHWAFYGIMIGMPLTGWVIVSASPTNIPTLLYKTVPFPHLGFIHGLPLETRRALEENVGDVHIVLAWIAITLFLIHVGAALKHQFWTKDGVIYRMAPFLRPRSGSVPETEKVA